jgi:hypothetical protein
MSRLSYSTYLFKLSFSKSVSTCTSQLYTKIGGQGVLTTTDRTVTPQLTRGNLQEGGNIQGQQFVDAADGGICDVCEGVIRRSR